MISVVRVCCVVGLVLLSACTQYSTPPRSSLEVIEAYRPLSVTGSDLTIVLDTARFVIDDEEAVAAHLGRHATPRAQLFSLLNASFVSAMRTEAPFGRVIIAEPAEEVGGEWDTRFVLYVDTLHQYRAKYPSNSMFIGGFGGGDTQAVRHDVDYRLWDNQRQAVVAQGRVESEESIFVVPDRGSYVGAVEEMAEKLTQRLGIRRPF